MTDPRGRRRPFIVYGYPFDETSGGAIALLALCERLNQLGETAFFWPSNLIAHRTPRTWADVRKTAGNSIRRIRRRAEFDSGPFDVPLATRSVLSSGIVVYPEIVDGNPLGSPRVVRWLLHRPGHHTGRIGFDDRDLIFFYQDAFNDLALNADLSRRLTVTWFNPVYRREEGSRRAGTCYLLRKGVARASTRDLADAVVVDQLSHADKARAFNAHEHLHSYDEYSMYSVYAAVCGCIPVIEPVPGVSRDEWFPDEADRYGLAYGWDEVPWAVRTRPLLLDRLAQAREEEDAMVRRFADVSSAHFA